MQKRYVAIDGNDQWSGLPAAPNAAKSDGPFATLTRARDALRQWRRAGGSGPVEVTIGGGTYRLTESFVLGPEDSGTPDAPVNPDGTINLVHYAAWLVKEYAARGD